MPKLTNGVWQGSNVKPLSGSDVHMLDKLGGLKMVCLRVAWCSLILWFTQIMDDFANCEVGEPQPYLFKRDKSGESNGLGEPPELNFNLREVT